VQKNGGKISNILDARKEFDALVEKQFPNLYDSASKPMRSAISAMRGVLNDLVEKNLPSVGYKSSLRAQSGLLTAIDNMAEKAASGGSKEIGEVGAKTKAVINTAKTIGKFAAGFGVAMAGSDALGFAGDKIKKLTGL
jgi:hypothetical protein